MTREEIAEKYYRLIRAEFGNPNGLDLIGHEAVAEVSQLIKDKADCWLEVCEDKRSELNSKRVYR